MTSTGTILSCPFCSENTTDWIDQGIISHLIHHGDLFTKDLTEARAAIRLIAKKKIEEGLHKPTKHYWYMGRLVEAPKGIHGEECEKCDQWLVDPAVVAAVKGGKE